MHCKEFGTKAAVRIIAARAIILRRFIDSEFQSNGLSHIVGKVSENLWKGGYELQPFDNGIAPNFTAGCNDFI